MLSKIYKLSALLLLAVMFSPSVFVVGVRANAQSSSAPTSLSLGEVFTPPISALNPFNPVSEFTILGIIYDYMFSLNWPPLPEITPVMAGGYSSNANGTHWVIGVRPNLKWDNGTPLNATDLWFTLMMDNESGFFSPQISNMSILNSTSVSITLAGPNPLFILKGFINNGVAVLPYQTFGKVSFANLTNFQNLNNIVADGPYVITNYTGQSPLVFTANPNYWNGPPKLQSLNYYFYTSQSSELNAYVSGQIDAVSFTGAYSGLQAIANQPGHTLIGPPYATPGLTVEALLNDWVYPTNLTSFRRALAFATNVTQVNDELSGPYAPNSTANQDFLIPQYNQEIGFSNGTGPTGYSYNLATAKQILTNAGFKYSGSTLEYPNGTAVTLSIKYRTTVECCMASVATLLASQWGQLGITVTPTAVPSATLRGGANNASGWQVITAGVLGPQTDNGVTPGPGVLNDIGDYFVLNGTQHVSWNSSFYTIIQRMVTEPENSSAFNSDARTAVTMYVQGVPSIPLFNVYNWAAVSNNFNWGNPAQNTGVYYTQAITGLPYWALSLDVVGPATSGSTSTSTSTTATSTVTTSSVVASSNSTTASSANTGTTSTPTAVSTSTTMTTSSTGVPPTTSTTTTAAGTSNTTLYAVAGIIIVIIIIAAVAAAMRRRRPPATSTTTTTTTTTPP